MKFTKKSTIGDVIDADENNAVILQGFGLHCFGCPMSQMETLEEASEVHGFDVKLLLEKLYGYVIVTYFS